MDVLVDKLTKLEITEKFKKYLEDHLESFPEMNEFSFEMNLETGDIDIKASLKTKQSKE